MVQNPLINFSTFGLLFFDEIIHKFLIWGKSPLSPVRVGLIQMAITISRELIDLMIRSKLHYNRTGSSGSFCVHYRKPTPLSPLTVGAMAMSSTTQPPDMLQKSTYLFQRIRTSCFRRDLHVADLEYVADFEDNCSPTLQREQIQMESTTL